MLAEAGRIDVLIHNAGHMVLGPAEAFTPEQVAEVYDTNVLSTQRVNRAALPHLRVRGDGLVVWVGSSSSRGGTPPYPGPYFAGLRLCQPGLQVGGVDAVVGVGGAGSRFMPSVI